MLPLERVQVKGKRKCRPRKTVLEVIRRNERLDMLINSCIRDLDRKRMNSNRKSGANTC